MKTYLMIILIVCGSAMAASELMPAQEARKAVQEYQASLLINAEADLNNRIIERVEKAANEGQTSAVVEILKGESHFLVKTLRKLKNLGYKVQHKEVDSHDCLVIGW